MEYVVETTLAHGHTTPCAQGLTGTQNKEEDWHSQWEPAQGESSRGGGEVLS